MKKLHNYAPAKVLGLVMILSILNLSCYKSDSIDQEITKLHNHTIPPSSKLIHTDEIVREGESLITFWEFEVQSQWKEYIKWASENLNAQYSVINSNETKAIFRRTLIGDAYSIQIEKKSTALPLHIRVKFEASPY
ncbi:MAG: hypothetical protein WBD99_16670 [Thermodesulfobacteriota bacterium]